MAFTLDKGLEPALSPDPGTEARLLVGVGDCVADAPIIPCEKVEAEFMPDAASEAVGVTRMPAVSVGAFVLVGLGVEVALPGGTVSVGKSVSVNGCVGVQVGIPGMLVAVGVRTNGEQSGVLVGVAFGSSVSVGKSVLVDAMEVSVERGGLVGTTGGSVGTTGGSVGTTGGSVGTMGGSVGRCILVGWGGLSVFSSFVGLFPCPPPSLTPENEIRPTAPRIRNT